MQLANFPKTSDHFGRYYTKTDIATLLVQSMNLACPRRTIDLGAGDGALVGEASRQWKNTKFITVDIDKSAACAHLQSLSKKTFTHHTIDALDHSLADRIGIRYGEIDSALCNPPFIRPRWKKHFAEILEDAGLSDAVDRVRCMPADVLFIAQNLRFLKANGKLGLILPDSILAGERYSRLRELLANKHRIERVIELPRRVFKSTDAKAHIVILSKSSASETSIQIQSLRADGTLTKTIEVDRSHAAKRLDYSSLSRCSRTRRSIGISIRDIAVHLSRGSYSSAQKAQQSFPVFHTTDIGPHECIVAKSFTLSSRRAGGINGTVAEVGDILLARVGRNLEHKIAKVVHGPVVISDCLLLLRVRKEFQMQVFQFLTSKTGRNAIAAASHGVAAKFVTTEAILNLQF